VYAPRERKGTVTSSAAGWNAVPSSVIRYSPS
jgi:hypothetical protein